ncbi:MAG: dihydrofolate reductase family protein, partial [Coprococcus sp.]
TEMLGQMQIDSILIEGGATLAAAAFEADIVDKVQMYVAPMIIGGASSRTPVGGRGIAHLADAWKLRDISARNIGNDICISGYVMKQEV